MNPVVGNMALDGIDHKVVATMSDDDKIRSHLSFALAELQAADVSAATADAQRRADMLKVLGEYIDAGRFPRHDQDAVSPHCRKPCFIDSDGTPCAVANLMMASGASESMLNLLASEHKLDTIEEMIGDERVEAAMKCWAADVGLEASELALIQPTYEFRHGQEARRNREMFENIVSNLRLAMVPSNSLDVAAVSRDIVAFGCNMRGGHYGYSLKKSYIPSYMETLDELDGEVGKLLSEERAEDLQALSTILRKEVDMEQKTGPGDYELLLSKADLEKWESEGKVAVARKASSSPPFW